MDRQSAVTDIDEISKTITVTIEEGVVNAQIEQALNEAAKTASIKGFRPGKAPRQMIEQTHGAGVRRDVRSKLISSSLYDVIQEKELEVVGYPTIDEIKEEGGLQYTATVWLYPRPDITDYTSFEITIPKSEVKNEDVDKMVERFRESVSPLKEVAFRTTAKAGDHVEVRLAPVVEGKPDFSKSEMQTMMLGEGTPQFLVDGIIGMEVNSEKIVVEPCREAHDGGEAHAHEHAVHVSLVSIKERVLVDLTDDLVKKHLQKDTVLQFRTWVRELLEKEMEKGKNEHVISEILTMLIEKHPFKVPQVMVDSEIRSMLSASVPMEPKARERLAEMSMEPFREGFGEKALMRVRSDLILDRIAENEGMDVTDEDISGWARDLQAEGARESEEEMVAWVRNNPQARESLETIIKRRKVLDLLKSRAVLTESSE